METSITDQAAASNVGVKQRLRSDGGGRTWATIATLLQTARMNDVDPQAWLTQTLERIAKGWPSSDLDALMPWNYTR